MLIYEESNIMQMEYIGVRDWGIETEGLRENKKVYLIKSKIAVSYYLLQFLSRAPILPWHPYFCWSSGVYEVYKMCKNVCVYE